METFWSFNLFLGSIIKFGDWVACYQSRWTVYNSLSPLLSLRSFSKHVLYVLWRLCHFFFPLRVFLEWSSIVRVLHGFAAVNLCHGFHSPVAFNFLSERPISPAPQVHTKKTSFVYQLQHTLLGHLPRLRRSCPYTPGNFIYDPGHSP